MSLSPWEREGAAKPRKGEDRVRAYANQPIGTVPRARELRRNAPAPERRLLRGLREAFPHLKWRHQSPIGPYFADVLCFSERLVIEVDGDTHVGRETSDARRTAFVRAQGYRVLRFTNADVMQNLDGVIAEISFSLREREGAPKARKGDDRTISDLSPQAKLPSPLRRAGAAPPLSRRERGA